MSAVTDADGSRCMDGMICDFVSALKGKWLELSTQHFVDSHSACIEPEVKCQGHTVII